MGYTTQGTIANFWPDNTDDTMYVAVYDDMTLNDLLDIASEYFSACTSPNDISITVENIHTSCIYYDLYEPSDYTLFYVLLWEPKTA